MIPRYSDNLYVLDNDRLIGQIDEFDIYLASDGDVFLFWGADTRDSFGDDHFTNIAAADPSMFPPHILEYARALGNLAS